VNRILILAAPENQRLVGHVDLALLFLLHVDERVPIALIALPVVDGFQEIDHFLFARRVRRLGHYEQGQKRYDQVADTTARHG
jgi:hypothetical protein